MNESQFIAFLNSTASKGGATFNLKTQNASKQARSILQESKYNMLAKQHINANVVNAYYNNTQFKAKLDEVMQELHITIIA